MLGIAAMELSDQIQISMQHDYAGILQFEPKHNGNALRLRIMFSPGLGFQRAPCSTMQEPLLASAELHVPLVYTVCVPRYYPHEPPQVRTAQYTNAFRVRLLVSPLEVQRHITDSSCCNLIKAMHESS
jgi:hypothetical protein